MIITGRLSSGSTEPRVANSNIMGSKGEEIKRSRQYLPFKIGKLTPAMVMKAEQELNETEANKAAAITELRKLIKAEESLHCWTDDEYLLQFCRARKFNVKKAFQLLRNFFEVKKGHPEIYGECDVPALKSLLEDGPSCFLPYRDDDGSVILVVQMGKWNPDDFSITTALSAFTMMVLLSVEDPATQVCGVRIIFDTKDIGLKHMRCVTPRYIHLLSRALRNCLPVRFKGIHFVNECTILQYLWALLKVFLTEKIRKRAHFHGSNPKSLQKFIPKAILSGDYDGDNVEFDNAQWCQKGIGSFYEKYKDLHDCGYMD